ncbi:MAG: helix-turn-helix domain-containing protein [Propionibacteriaceae bacterium]|nr:helix-turn-helix domain-containing protein [Propionibacteriaceae bacterium]
MMRTSYDCKADLIAFEIVDAIEGGDIADAYAEFDIDAIAEQVVTSTGQGGDLRFMIREDIDFWEVVLDNTRPPGHRGAERDDDAPLVRRWPSHYGPYLTQAQAHEITRSAPDRALTITGQMSHDTDLVRLAYIKRTQGRAMVTATERAAEAAEDRAGQWAARKAIAAAFTQAHAHARARWEAEHADQLAARRMSGPIVLAIRTALDMGQQALADHLGVSRQTVRDWERGTALVPVGATDEIWEIWNAYLAALAQRMPQGITDPDTDLETLQRMLILRGPGNRLTTDPGPLTIHHAHQHHWPDRGAEQG